MKRLLRFSAVILAAALLTALLPVQALAADAKATTLRLEDTEGTVSTENARGKTLTLKKGSKLYNGYSVSTAAASYAWISLDDSTVVKLDASSKATVKQDGKKLEVQLESGNLIFNVSKPLDADASLDIRTSSMSTGVRGTAGLVSVAERSKSTVNASGQSVTIYEAASRLVILEGTVSLTYSNAPLAAAGQPTQAAPDVATTQVASGWQADVLKTTAVVATEGGTSASTQVKADLAPVSIQETLLSAGYAAVEVAATPALLERIVQAPNDLDAKMAGTVVEKAGTLLKEEQRVAAEQVKQAEAAVKKALEETVKEMEQKLPQVTATNPAPVISVFEPQAPTHSGSSGSSKPDPTPPTPPDPPVPPDPDPEPDPDPDPEPDPDPVSQWTVTFQYPLGTTYAVQTVADGGHAQKPLLQPTLNGVWRLSGVEYAFEDTPVTANVTLVWLTLP